MTQNKYKYIEWYTLLIIGKHNFLNIPILSKLDYKLIVFLRKAQPKFVIVLTFMWKTEQPTVAKTN